MKFKIGDVFLNEDGVSFKITSILPEEDTIIMIYHTVNETSWFPITFKLLEDMIEIGTLIKSESLSEYDPFNFWGDE